MTDFFDPFSDRTARNIRNSLSTALVAELTGSGTQTVDEVVRDWLKQDIATVYSNYLRNRQPRYAQAITEIERMQIQDPRLQAVVLWNAGLFFEVHELLETMWLGATGIERTALKGFIQAAGVYVHCRRGNMAAGQGLASRARVHLKTASQALDFIANLDELLESLINPTDSPPSLQTIE